MEAEAPGLIFTVAVFLVALTVLVFVHEMGHFLVARWCKVKVDVFSVGFGKELWGKYDKHGTRWRVSAIPLGGYVKFFGDSSGASTADKGALSSMSDADKAVSFHHQKLWKRAAIVFAGPFVNLVFAALIFASIVFINGARVTSTEVGFVGESAAAEGLVVGDIITSINGRSVDRFDELQEVARFFPDQKLDIELLRGEQPIAISLSTASMKMEDRWGNEHLLGVLAVGAPVQEAVVDRIYLDSTAQKYDFKKEDRIIAVNGLAINTVYELRDSLAEKADQAAFITIERDGELIEKDVIVGGFDQLQEDGTTRKVGFLGITLATGQMQEFGLIASLAEGSKTTVRHLKNFTTTIGQLILGLRSVKELSGPVGMAAMVGEVAQTGFTNYMIFVALISINLGFVNLLPIPLLDGGHLMFYGIEAVKGSPLPERAQELAFMVGFVFVIGLMLFLTLNDLHSIVL